MKYTATILVLMITVAFTACDKTRTCPAFDDSTLKAWFPYETGVTYKFTSSDGRQEMFIIEQENYSQVHEVKKFVWGKKYYCEINGERKTVTDSVMQDVLPLKLFHVVETDFGHSDYVGGISMTFRTMPRAIVFSAGEKLSLAGNKGYSAEYFDVWNVNGRQYKNITDITIEGEEAEKIGMDKIYIGMNAGIIGYRTYPDGREYWQE